MHNKIKRNDGRRGNTTPFDNAEEAWFWFINAQQARNDGARYTAGLGTLERPCEPTDILKILDRLYRNRQLLREHLLVLRHYGRRQYKPDRHRVKEAQAYYLWQAAFEKIEPVLIAKNIVHQSSVFDRLEKTDFIDTDKNNYADCYA